MPELTALDRLRARRLKDAVEAAMATDERTTIHSIATSAGMHAPTLHAYIAQRRRVTEDALRRLQPFLKTPLLHLLGADQDTAKRSSAVADTMIVSTMERDLIERFRALSAKDQEAAGAWLFLASAATRDREIRSLLLVVGRLQVLAAQTQASTGTNVPTRKQTRRDGNAPKGNG